VSYQAMPAAERMWQHVEKTDGCWEWRGSKHPNGYGRIKTVIVGQPTVNHLVHRLAYESLRGPIPSGLVLDHLCRNRGCVNPAHMEPVSNRENILRSPTCFSAVNARKTHCPKGHPLSGDNLAPEHLPGRVCKTCRNDRQRMYHQNKKARLTGKTVAA
jgi:hypothetical protein